MIILMVDIHRHRSIEVLNLLSHLLFPVVLGSLIDRRGLQILKTEGVSVEEALPPAEVVAPPVNYKIFIIGGCFSIEQNALKMADEEKAKGFEGVFVMKRGSMFYVCYGQYATLQEAKADLPRVWQTCPKAWILNKN